jgi:hypothetical protein
VILAQSPSGVLTRWCSSRSWSFRLLTIDSIRCRMKPIAGWPRSGSSSRRGRENERVEFADGLFEVVPGVALVADDELARDRLAGEQRERRLALGRVCGDEVKVADASVWVADEDELHSPVEAGVGSRVAEAAPGGELGAVDGLHALPAGQRRRVDEAKLVVEAGELASDRAPERDQLRRELPAALVVARLARQLREQMPESPTSNREEAAVARLTEQHLRHHRAEQLIVGDPLGPTAPWPRVGRKERAGSAIECDYEGVEVGAHAGLQADGAFATPTFDTLVSGPCPMITPPPVNYRSSI